MRFLLQIAGLGFQIESPVPFNMHPHYLPYLQQSVGGGVLDAPPAQANAGGGVLDAPPAQAPPAVTVRLSTAAPVYPAGPPKAANGRIVIYDTPLGEFREHRVWSQAEKSPDNPCLIPEAPGRWRLTVPAARLAGLADRSQFLWMLAPEARLAEHDRLLLHAASVVLEGRAWLFCGPPGIGKSTHAALWAETFGAAPLTGDRTVLEMTDAGFVAHGSPFCGSSNLCVLAAAPLGGIAVLAQGPENRAEPLPAAEAFRLLYAQTTVNTWNPAQTAALCDLLLRLIAERPAVRLTCRPDPAAAELCRKILFSAP